MRPAIPRAGNGSRPRLDDRIRTTMHLEEVLLPREGIIPWRYVGGRRLDSRWPSPYRLPRRAAGEVSRMRVDETQLSSVVFLCNEEQGEDGVIRPEPRATAFFVGVREEGGPGVLPYVVTARHCVEEASDPLYIRVN